MKSYSYVRAKESAVRPGRVRVGQGSLLKEVLKNFVVDKFNGSNYDDWAWKMQLYFRQTLYDAIVARYSSPPTAALSRLMLPYLFPDLAAFATVTDLITHLRTSDTRYRAALPAEFCAKNPPPPHPPPPMYITLYYLVTRLPDSLRSVRDHFLSLCPTTLTVDLIEERLLAAEKSIVAVGASRVGRAAAAGGRGARVLEETAGAAVVAVVAAEGVGVEVGVVAGVRASVAAAAAAAAVGAAAVVLVRVALCSGEALLREWYAGRGRSGGAGPCTYVLRTGKRSGETCGGPHATHRYFGRLTDAWRIQFPDTTELPRWGNLLKSGVAIFDLDYDAILAAMYAVNISAEGDCYLCVPPDPGIEAAALGDSESAAPGAGEAALSGTASAQVLRTFTLDSGASRSFFRDCTTLSPLGRPAAISLADPSGGPVLAHSSTVLPCPPVSSGSLSGLHLPSFSTNLVSGADLQNVWVDQFTPGAMSSQVFAAASRSSTESAPCSCRLLSQRTLLWHHRLGHPSLPCLRGMASCVLVTGLPRSLPSLPLGPAPTCVPCVEGRQRAAPHSSEFPPTKAPLQTLHMDVWGPARVRGQGHERYFLLVVDDYSRYTTVFTLRRKGEVTEVLIDWIRAVRRQLSESFDSNLPVLRLHSDRGPPPVDPLPTQGPAPSGVSQVDAVEPVEVADDSGAAQGAEPAGAGSGGAEPVGVEPGGAKSAGDESAGAEPGVAESGGTEPEGAEHARVEAGGAEPGGPSGALSRQEPLSTQQLRELFARRWSRAAGAGGATSAEVPAAAVATGGSGATGPGGARIGGTRAAGPGGAAGAKAARGARTGGAAGAGTAGSTGAGATRAAEASCGPAGARAAGGAGAGGAAGEGAPGGARVGATRATGAADGAGGSAGFGADAGGAGAVPASSGGTTRLRPYFCVPLPSPPASSLPALADPDSDSLRATSPTVTRLLATVVTDPSFESTSASALVAELVDFAVHCRLDYAASLVAESESACPPSAGGECAFSTDVLEDRVKRPSGSPPVFKARYVARGFGQLQGVDSFHTFSPTAKMTTLGVMLHVAAQRDYKLHSLDFSTAFLQGSLHEEIWLHRPPGFTGSFPPGTQWSLRRPVYGLCQAPHEWHDTLRTTLAALGFAPSIADLSLFLRTDTTLQPFYILMYIDDLVFATADTAGLTHVKSELQKRHTCTDLGELRSYLGLKITRDRARRTITLTQSHMVQQVLQRFDFTYSSPQATPLSTRHSLSALPFDESVEPSGPYPELVGCLIFSCEPEIYAGAMAAQELRWLTYLLTDLGEAPRFPPVLYVDNKAMLALCQEHRLEHRTKHIARLYFLARELQQPGQLRLAYVATRANTADIFTRALQPCDHRRFCTMLVFPARIAPLGKQLFLHELLPLKGRFPMRRPALQLACCPALQLARRPALQPARRPALQLARRPALQFARCPALQPARRPTLQSACHLPCSPRTALHCNPCATLTCSTRAALPCSPRAALPCSLLAAMPCSARASLPCCSHACSLRLPCPVARVPCPATCVPCSHCAPHCSPRCPATRLPTLLAPCAPCCPCALLTYYSASRGGHQQQRQPEPLSPQHLREWFICRGLSGPGAWDFVGAGGLLPQQLRDWVSQRRLPGSAEATSVGACEPGSTCAASVEALHTFMLDSGATRCFFRDCTTVTPLIAPVPVSLADPSGGPFIARASTVIPCPAAPSGSHKGFHLPSFSNNMVSNAVLHNQFVTVTTPKSELLAICTDSRTGEHLTTFTWSPGSGLYTLTTESAQRAAPHSSSFPPTTAPLQTLHMDIEQFQQDLQALQLHSDRGGKFCSCLLEDFCVMEVARTSMIHAAAPLFLWSFAVHQLNHWPRVSVLETLLTLRWTGEVGDASAFQVGGALSLVRDTTVDKLSPCTLHCVFLGFPTDALPWPFYLPALCWALSSHDITFDESVCFYRLHPRASSYRPSSWFQVDQPPLVEPLEVSSDTFGPAKGEDPAADNTVTTSPLLALGDPS
ncbi:unnamed protein product [Closterium sp. NIES-53]